MTQDEWMDLANGMCDAMREVRTALDDYQMLLNKAYEARGSIIEEKREAFMQEWRLSESGLEQTDDPLRDMVAIVDYIEGELV